MLFSASSGAFFANSKRGCDERGVCAGRALNAGCYQGPPPSSCSQRHTVNHYLCLVFILVFYADTVEIRQVSAARRHRRDALSPQYVRRSQRHSGPAQALVASLTLMLTSTRFRGFAAERSSLVIANDSPRDAASPRC